MGCKKIVEKPIDKELEAVLKGKGSFIAWFLEGKEA
jgi:hypothetical protein